MQTSFYPFKHFLEFLHGDLTSVLIKHLDETTHVSSLEIMREIDKQIKYTNGVLQTLGSVSHANRVSQAFDTYFVYGNVSLVGKALDVGYGIDVQI